MSEIQEIQQFPEHKPNGEGAHPNMAQINSDPNMVQWKSSSGSMVKAQNESVVMGAVPKYHAFTVPVGQDLLLILREFCRKYNIYSAFVVSCIGAISSCTYRCSLGKRSGAGKEIRKLSGFYQLCSVQGTLSANYFRLCGTFGDANGDSHAGQLLDNVMVASPCEVVICELPGVAFTRTVSNPVTAPEGQLHLHCTSDNQIDMKDLSVQAEQGGMAGPITPTAAYVPPLPKTSS